MRQKRTQRLFGNPLEQQIVERFGQIAIVLQPHQLAAEPRHIGMFDQIIAQLAGFHGRGRGQHRSQIAMLGDQFGRGFRTHPRHTRHIIDAVTHQGEDIAQPLGTDAEFLDDIVGADAAIVHRVEQIYSPVGDTAHTQPGKLYELHQVLVGGNDCDAPTLRQRRFCVAGDDVVGLKPDCFDARNRKSTRRVADHRELRDQILGRRRTVRLILVIHVVAKRL